MLLPRLPEVASEFQEMVDRVTPAASILREKHRQRDPAWSRLFVSPIRLTDGTILFTLKDAAQRILEAPAAPSSRVAAQRIIDAALRGADMTSTSAAVRLALLKVGQEKN